MKNCIFFILIFLTWEEFLMLQKYNRCPWWCEYPIQLDSINFQRKNIWVVCKRGYCPPPIIANGKWERGALLGRGSFGTVYQGISGAGYFFAVKEISLLEERSHGRQCVKQLEQEIKLLSQFQHENIVQYFGTEKDDSTLYIFLELATQGSLARVYRQESLSQSHISCYTRQILMGLKYLHHKNVIHRDIKCANILVFSDGIVKLADFGLAKVTRSNDLKSFNGSAYWIAPEVVKNEGYGLPADIWSLGCTVLEMLTCQVPHFPLEPFQALYKVWKGKPPAIPKTLPKDAVDFIQQCVRVNPNKRPTAAELLFHPFVTVYEDPLIL